MLLLLLDVFTIAKEEEEISSERPDREDGDGGMLLQTGVDGWTFTSTMACSKQ
jgi:hypothetical protein